MRPSKEIVFLGSSLEDLSAFPVPVKRVTGHALRLAQQGEHHPDAKAMAGFKHARVMEIPVDHDRATYRTMYTVSFGDVVYVLHAFQKKSTRGIVTPRRHLDTIEQRLKQARELHEQREKEQRDDDERLQRERR